MKKLFLTLFVISLITLINVNDGFSYRQSIDVFGGYNFMLVGDWDSEKNLSDTYKGNFLKGGFAFGLDYCAKLSPLLSIGLELAYLPLISYDFVIPEDTTTTPTTQSIKHERTLQTVPIMVMGRLQILKQLNFIGGIGYGIGIETLKVSGQELESDLGSAPIAMLGVEFDLLKFQGAPASLPLGVRYYAITDDKKHSTLLVTVGISVEFW